MRLLHTADWHLGQKFYFKNRKKEHTHALNWLINTIIEKKIDLLVVAGDIFDTDNPPNYARKLYYNFIQKLESTPCQHLVIVAGNHDSANMLEAPKELLATINVTVIGHLPQERKDQIIEIKDANQQLIAVIGAVPFLRDKDIRYFVSGQSSTDRVEALKQGIRQHYQEIEEALLPYQDKDVPIIVTGHLFVDGGERDPNRDNTIHIGCIDVIGVDSFSTDFDYVALGHLHRNQQVDKNRPIFYSGSLIPLDFSELNYGQSVILVEFEGRTITKRQSLKVDLARYLRHYKGTKEYVVNKLENIDHPAQLDTWIKIDLEETHYSPSVRDELEAIVKDKAATILYVQQHAPKDANTQKQQEQIRSLEQMQAIEVFRLCAQQNGQISDEEMQELENSFVELQSWMQEQDKE